MTHQRFRYAHMHLLGRFDPPPERKPRRGALTPYRKVLKLILQFRYYLTTHDR